LANVVRVEGWAGQTKMDGTEQCACLRREDSFHCIDVHAGNNSV